jgi:VCBS repeat-containing protein
LNFVDKFDAKLPVDGLGAHSNAYLHVDSMATHGPSDAIIVPDAHLLFTGDFKRSGVDLILSDDDHRLVLRDYFKGENRAALSSPDGAHLTGDIVNALTGHVEYAQANGSASVAQVIGHVTKLTGTATAIRNGVSIILNQGDNVEKGDVLQSGSDSTLGVTFIDGTVFGLSANARMVLNEMIYDPNGSNNSSLLSLVAGTISFVAGETAKHGDMKVDTPVATMGIRGTAVLVEIDFNVPQGDAPDAKFQVLVEPDGSTGSYILFDKATLTPIATVNQAGTQVSISHGNVNFSATAPLSDEMQKLITDVFSLKFSDNSNTNTKTAEHFTDTLTPQSFAPFILANGMTAVPVFVNVNAIDRTPSSNTNGPTPIIQHIDQPPTVVTFDNAFSEHLGVTGSPAVDFVSGKISFVDINAGDRPTAKAVFDSFTYQDAHQHSLTATLTATELAAIKAVEIPLSVTQDPGNNNNGSATWSYSLPDGAFDFLGAGETLTLTYLAQVSNNYAPNIEITTKPITITITGTNDAPVITSSAPQTITFAAGIDTPGGDLTTKVPTSGTLSFADADLTDTHSVSTKLVGETLNGKAVNLPPTPLKIFETALTAAIAADSTGTGSGKINWKLADLPVYLGDFIPSGETLTLTYAVTVKDSQGATATKDITVAITGTATPAVVWIATTTPGSPPGGLWSDPLNWETGTVPTATDDAIVITNQLIGLTPSYPVTINAPAVARSLTMNDFGTSPPQLINQSTLTIGGTVSMSADSVIDNSGTITVGGLMEVLDQSILQNSGAINLQQGGDFKGQSTISNASTGTIKISGGTLNVQVDVTNSGQITVDSGAALRVSAATITNTGIIEVLALGVLTLDQLTTVANAGGTIAIDGTGTLTLDDATINGGIIDDYSTVSGNIVAGDIDVTGSSTISGASLNHGNVTVERGQTLTLDNVTVTGTTISETGATSIVQIDGGTTLKLNGATIDGGTINDYSTAASGSIIAADIDVTGSSTISNAILNKGDVTIANGATLTLDDDTVNGTTFTAVATGSIIQVDGHDALTLNSVTINGGAVSIGTQAHILTSGDVTLAGTSVANGGTIEVHDGTLKITGSITGSGSVQIDGGALFEIDGSDTQNVVFSGTGGELQIDASSFGGSIAGLAATDELDLRTIGFGLNTTGTYVSDADHDGGILTITDGTHSISMTLVGDYCDAHFAGAADGHGGTLITLNAADDAPVFAPAETAQSATLTELADTTGSSSSDPSPAAGGSIHFTDIDLTDRPTATITAQSVTWTDADQGSLSSTLTQPEIDALEHALSLTQMGNTNNGAIGWTYSITDSALDFLGAGETAKVVSTITLKDHHGMTDTATVTVTIDGSNDAPVLAADASGSSGSSLHVIYERANTTGDTTDLDTASGTLTFTDVDLSDTHTASQSAPTYVWSGGTLTTAQTDTLTAAGTLALSETDSTHSGAGSIGFSYSAADSTFDFLAAGQTLTITYEVAVTDNNHAASTEVPVTITVTGTNDVPVLNEMTLTVSQGTTNVLTSSDFSVTDPDSTSFTCSVYNVTGGQFEVFNGTNWLSAPTGGFTNAQIAAGQVEFVQDGTATAPNFSISVSDGTEASPAIAPTVNFGDGPSISLDHIAMVSHEAFGGSGEHEGAAVTYANNHLYLSYNNGPANFDTSDTATVVGFNTASDGPSWTFANAWGNGDFFGLAADGSQIYAVGESHPDNGLTHDLINGGGDGETKSILVRFDADGTAGNDPSPADGYTATNFYSYSGFESFDNVVATVQGGNTILYAFGFGQPASYSGYIIGEYDSSGTLLHFATDPLPVPGSSDMIGAVDFNGAIWAVGESVHSSLNETNPIPTVWTVSYDLGLIVAHEDNLAPTGDFTGAAAIGDALYAVGTVSSSDGGDYLIAKYNADGSVAWSETFGGSGVDGLNGAVAADGRLFVVGSTTSVGSTEGVLMEINPSNGTVISTTTYGLAQYNSFTSITTDGQHLYIAGVSGSSVSQDQAVLVTYDIGGATRTTVEDTAVNISSLAVSDVTAGSAQIEVTLAVGHGSVTLQNSHGLDSVVGAGTGSVELFGSQAAINAALADGVIYDPSANYIGSDTLMITANDQGHNGTGVALSNTQEVSLVVTAADLIADGATDTISAPSGDTIAFASGHGTLDLAQPATFTGEIAGISGTGDVLDIHGFAGSITTAVTGTGSYDSIFNTTTLTVTDSADHQFETFKLAGDLSGSNWTVTDDGHGGANIVDPPAASPLSIANGASLEIANPVASGEGVTFHGSTGSLTLDAPSSFAGLISGFTGDGTLAGSDQIDLRGIDYHSHSFSESYNPTADTLTVSDGTNDATLHFNGTYQAANFSFQSDGNGGTIVYDPPVAASADSGAGDVQAHGPATGSHGFVFNFAGVGRDMATDFHLATDAHEFGGPISANAQAALNALHNDSHAVMPPDAHDAMALADIVKAQLHANDFHFV